MDERLDGAPIGVLEVSDDGTVEAANDVALSLIDAASEPVGEPLDAVFPESVEDTLPDAVRGDGVDEAEFEEYYPTVELWLAVTVVPVDGGATVYLRDVTDRRRQAQSLDRLREERERTAVIDEVRSEVLAELVGASSREEIAETICRELGESDIYAFAWVGEREIGSDGLAIRAAEGETGETFAAVRETLDGPATTPEERAVESGEIREVQPLADDPQVPEAVRIAGFADGVQSALAIPLVYGSNVHGVVGVYAGRKDGFSDRERTSFQTLGEIAGFAITAARNRNLLLSDSVTEITFDVGTDSPLSRLSDDLGAELTLEGLVPNGDESLLCYVASDADAAAVGDVADGLAGVGSVRVIDDGGTGRSLEIEVDGDAPLVTVSSLGGTVRRATYEDGRGRIVVDLPPDGDVRRMADAVGRDADAEVRAKRERERSVTTAREFRAELDDRLTDRQRAVLRAAYLADYFESPRGSTAEEIASSLDITGSTLLHHLRASQRKLLDAYFTEDAVGDD